MRFHTALKLLALTFVFAFLSAGVVRADNQYATIRGQVVDQTKATIPGAQITATNTGTNEVRTVTTQADGSFEFLSLPIGTYNVSVTKDGFQTYQATGIVLVINQIYVLNPTLQVGSASQTISVEAAKTQVETTSMQLGTTVEAKTIVDMPLNGRNWVQLQQLQPGVVASSDRFGSNYATNGAQSQQNSYLINGTDSNDLPLNSPLILPSPDAIQEFRMITNTINPEYGRNSGAILDAVIKSGTNQFHGDAFEFYRDTFLNNRNFFQRGAPVFHQNQFGGTIGGPVWKDHTFFFFSYQGTRAATPQGGGNVPVFTNAQLGGNFGTVGVSKFTSSKNSSPIPEFGDAASTCQVSGGVMCPAGTAYSSLFSTGVIPTQDFNALSSALITKFVPAANCNNLTAFCFNPSTVTSTNQYLFQVNQNIGQHDTLWFYGLLQYNPDSNTLPFIGSNLPGFGSVDQRTTKQFTFAENHIFSANTLNELRVAYTRFNFQAVIPQTPTLPSSLGWQINSQNTKDAGLPVLSVQGLFSLGFSNDGPQPRIDQTKQLTDNFSHIAGRHTLKLGFEGRIFWVTNPFSFENNGSFGFNNNGAFSTGVGGADFLLGIPASYGQASGGFIDARAREAYFYAQDEYKLKPTFTLTYGLGYQIDTPLKDIFNNSQAINCFNPNFQSTVFPNAPRGLLVPGDANCPAAGYSTHYNEFGPRLGFAWAPTNLGRISGDQGNFSIRGGVGVYYNRSEEEVTLQNLTSPPFQLSDAGIGDIGGTPSFIAPFTSVQCINQANAPLASSFCSSPSGAIANKYPYTAPAKGATVNWAQFEPMVLTVNDPRTQVPMAYNYNLTVQRQMPGQIILSLGYVGSMSRRNYGVVDLNPGINPAGCAATPACVNNPGFQRINFPNNFRYSQVDPLNGNTPFFGGIGQMGTFLNSNYNSFQASANKALSHGLDFLVSYTYSHSLDFGSSFENASFGPRGVNPFNMKAGYGDSAFDARHRLVISYDYMIPGVEHLSAMHWVPNRVADGWHIAGITTLQTGFPIFTTDSGLTSLTCDFFTAFACWDAPNFTGPLQISNIRASSFAYTSNPNEVGTNGAANHYYFNPNAFTQAPIGTIGTAGRSFFHGPGINNTDLALMKDTRVTESTSLELRMDFFNIFNHTQFNQNTSSGITGDINDPNFGREFSAANGRLIQLAAKFIF